MEYRPEDFEAGEDITHLVEKPDRPAGFVISVRLDRESAKALFALAKRRGKFATETARELLAEAIAQHSTPAGSGR
jgi:hypothetical protein